MDFRSFAGRRSSRVFDCAVLAVVTLAALFYCYDVEVLPNDTKPHTLELDELLLVSTIVFGGLFLCALRWLIDEQRGTSRIANQGASVARREILFPLLADRSKARWETGTIENFGARSGEEELEALGKQTGLMPVGRPSKNAEIEAAIDALTAEGIDLSKLPRKDAYLQVRQRAASLGANVEIGFSVPVIQRVLVRRYGPRA